MPAAAGGLSSAAAMGRPLMGSPGRGAAAAAARSLPVGRAAAAKVRRVQQTQKVENDDH